MYDDDVAGERSEGRGGRIPAVIDGEGHGFLIKVLCVPACVRACVHVCVCVYVCMCVCVCVCVFVRV